MVGALVSPDPTDQRYARIWLNCVEEIVFVDDDFCNDEPGTDDLFPHLSKVQSLQAAYMVCLYQTWEGTTQSKSRIRRHRFGTLIAVVRDIGIENARHPSYSNTDLQDFAWKDFVTREELVRVFLWVFLLDTAFVIFNNHPPRMMIKEMGMDLASNEAIFQAITAESCLKLLQKADLGCERMLLRSATEQLRQEQTEPLMKTAMADLGPLNLFIITSALHSLLFQYQNSFGSPDQLVPIRRALENWKTMWKDYIELYSSTANHMPIGTSQATPENMWQRIGFVQHASEYWLLASLVLDRLCASKEQVSNHNGVVQDAISQKSEPHPDLGQPMLQKYDETSMRQVNELIATFQRTSISQQEEPP